MIIGIDNGLDGGLPLISKTTGALINKTVMPTLRRGSKREVDAYKLYQWILGLDEMPSNFVIAIEEPLHHANLHKQ